MEKEIIIHKIVCPAARCTCARGGGKLIAEIWCHRGDSFLVRTTCPNDKRLILSFAFGVRPPEPSR